MQLTSLGVWEGLAYWTTMRSCDTHMTDHAPFSPLTSRTLPVSTSTRTTFCTVGPFNNGTDHNQMGRFHLQEDWPNSHCRGMSYQLYPNIGQEAIQSKTLGRHQLYRASEKRVKI